MDKQCCKCEAFNSFGTVSSDHRIVTASITLKLRANKLKENQIPRYNWSTLQDQNISNEFKIKVTNRYQVLQENCDEQSANAQYQNFEKACAYAAEKVIPLEPKAKKRIPWETRDISEKKASLKEAAQAKNQNPSRANRYSFRTAQSDFKLNSVRTGAKIIHSGKNKSDINCFC